MSLVAGVWSLGSGVGLLSLGSGRWVPVAGIRSLVSGCIQKSKIGYFARGFKPLCVSGALENPELVDSLEDLSDVCDVVGI